MSLGWALLYIKHPSTLAVLDFSAAQAIRGANRYQRLINAMPALNALHVLTLLIFITAL